MEKYLNTFSPLGVMLYILLILTGCKAGTNQENYQVLDLSGATIHYDVAGEGFPLILIHGSLTDMRYWERQVPTLQKYYCVYTYSRRYNYPNQNQPIANHSAIVEAEDLLNFMDALEIKEANILGHSYGAYTALVFAMEHPKRVKKMILAEPPIIRWLTEDSGNNATYDKFMHQTWNPIGMAYLKGGEKAGLDQTSKWYFQSEFDSIPEFWRTSFLQNSKEWELLATSSDAFPLVDMDRVKMLTTPTMLLSGALNTGNMNDLIDCKLEELLPNDIWIKIDNAGHEMFLDNSIDSNLAILAFLSANH
ncbi:alpha/beta fold hydrolase [Aquiflexum sp.]|uniref:alpha/beta fold hydrolase n=1 Tax=Aquiflexum sp. TaxID=1872584 RepID=UPI0035932311